jgi:hypothetical protein
MERTPFGSQNVITQHISEADLKAYFVGFDYTNYRLDHLINVLEKVIPEYAFGHHIGTQVNITEIINIVHEAAKSIYKIDEFQKVKTIYLAGGSIADDAVEKSFFQRGEFGELILHLLLRDFHKTVPLLSKIFFKDADGSTVHGFDAVHVQEETETLWLGESKLYVSGEKGVKALVKDIKSHFERNYLDREFALISKKLKLLDNVPKKDDWLKILESNTTLRSKLKSVTIPLLCTYTSDNFSRYNDEQIPNFISDYEKEIRQLKDDFDKSFEKNINGPVKTDLNIVLLLFPVKCKDELVRRMHQRLSQLQG